MNTKLNTLLSNLHRDQKGLTVPEMIMLAAFVIIPVIIAVGGFGQQILDALSGGVDNAKSEGEGIKWGGGS
jgi:Flp pilus assembly pilin Flp